MALNLSQRRTRNGSPKSASQLSTSRPVRLGKNGCNERFNGSLRDELLNGEMVYCLAEAKVLIEAIKKDIKPRDIVTRKALENAYTVVIALGGSTNAVLHFMAIAKEAELAWSYSDFDRIAAKTPWIADMKPGGRYAMHELHKVGGTPALMKALLEAGYLHGDCLTVTGQTIAENLKNVRSVYARPQRAHRDHARQPRP